MDARTASRLGVVAVGLGIAMAAGTGAASAAPANSDSSASGSAESSTSRESSRAHRESKSPRESDDTTRSSREARSSGPGSSGAGKVSTKNSKDRPQDADDRPPRKSIRRDDSESPGDQVSAPDIDTAGNHSNATPATDGPIERKRETTPVAEPTPATSVTAVQQPSVDPARPAAPTGILGWVTSVSAWVHREVDYFVRGGSMPTTRPGQLYVHDSDGAVLGSLFPAGDPRDALSYHIVGQPTAGTVTVDSEGVYVYTPSEFPTRGLSDTFTVAIRNTGFNLRSLMALFDPALNTTTVRVAVNIESGLEPPVEGSNTTRGFDIINLTQYGLTVTKVDGERAFDDPVHIGTVVQPGEGQHFEIVLSVFSDNQGVVHYSTGPTAQSDARIVMTVPSSFGGPPTIVCENVRCRILGHQAIIMEAPNTVVEVGADQPELQAKILDQLCFTGSRASCSFTATRQQQTYAVRQTVVKLENPADGEFRYTETLSMSLAKKESITISAKVSTNIFSMVTAELSSQYGHEWTTTETYTDTFKPVIPAWHIGWVNAEAPIIRYTGDFMIQIGNTTIFLRDVDFDQPDVSGTRPSRWSYTEEAIPRDRVTQL